MSAVPSSGRIGAAAHAGHAIRSLCHRVHEQDAGAQVTWAVLAHLHPAGGDLARALDVLARETAEGAGAQDHGAAAAAHLAAAARLSEQLAAELREAMLELQELAAEPPVTRRRSVLAAITRR